MIKPLSLIITLSLIFTSTPALAAFSDVPDGHPYKEAISYMQAQSIVEGYEDGTYRPDNTINRAEFTKILMYMMRMRIPIDPRGLVGKQACDVSSIPPEKLFSDVGSNQWYSIPVCEAKANGAIGGYPDGTFKPGNTINFAEAAKIIVNVYGYETGSDPVWYKPFTDALAARSAIPESITNFDKFITRGEMAEIIFRLEGNPEVEVQPESSSSVSSEAAEEEVSSSSSSSSVSSSSSSSSVSSVEEVVEEESNVLVASSAGGAYQLYKEGIIGNGETSMLFFHATWCPYCKAHDEFLTKLYGESAVSMQTYKIDYDTAQDLKEQFGIFQQDSFVLIDGEGNATVGVINPSDSLIKELLEVE